MGMPASHIFFVVLWHKSLCLRSVLCFVQYYTKELCCFGMNVECNFSRWIVQFLYHFRRLAGVKLGNPSAPDLYVYKILTSTNVHAPRSVLYDWKNVFVRPEALTSVTLKIIVFWDLMMCSLAEVYQCFSGMLCLHLQGRRVLCCLCSNTCCKEDLNTIGMLSIIVRQSSLLAFLTHSGFICI